MSLHEMTYSSWLQPMISVLDAQRDLVDRLARLARSQASLIAAGHTDQLLNLLAQRQAVIDEFETSQSKLGELAQGLDERLSTVTPADRNRMKALINEISERLAEVMQRDEVDQKELRQGRDRVKQELSTLGAARQARGAYRAVEKSAARFSDQRG